MITRQDVFKEIPTPDEVAKMKEPPMLMLIYKALFMILRLTLDIRWNIVLLDGGKNIKRNVRTSKKEVEGDNPVIKKTDNLKIEDKKDE